MNGCMSYVPGSHRIGYLIRKGIYLKKLQYSSYWSLKQFINFLAINNNYEYVKKNLDDVEFYKNQQLLSIYYQLLSRIETNCFQSS